MDKLRKFLHFIDRVSYCSGQCVSVAAIIMVAIIAYDVIMRYAFRSVMATVALVSSRVNVTSLES